VPDRRDVNVVDVLLGLLLQVVGLEKDQTLHQALLGGQPRKFDCWATTSECAKGHDFHGAHVCANVQHPDRELVVCHELIRRLVAQAFVAVPCTEVVHCDEGLGGGQVQGEVVEHLRGTRMSMKEDEGGRVRDVTMHHVMQKTLRRLVEAALHIARGPSSHGDRRDEQQQRSLHRA